MMGQLQLVAIVLLLVALAYVLYLYWKRQDMIECPSCGAHVELYSDECPHCGHEKEPLTDDDAEHVDVDELLPGDDDTAEPESAEDSQDIDEPEQEPEAPAEEEDDAEDTFRCEECGKEFDSEHGLKIHTGQKH